MSKFESYHLHKERVRLAEGAVLKTVDYYRFGGSIPSLSAVPSPILEKVRVRMES
jgi:hypothetical protein